MNAVTDRLELFRQIRSSVRGSEKYLLVGVDVAKNNHHAFSALPMVERFARIWSLPTAQKVLRVSEV
jgi:hypothetical protein